MIIYLCIERFYKYINKFYHILGCSISEKCGHILPEHFVKRLNKHMQTKQSVTQRQISAKINDHNK